jgi:IMP dehydrogenase
LIARTDLQKNLDNPLASKSAVNSSCCVVIGTRPEDRDRAKALIEAGVDVLVVD